MSNFKKIARGIRFALPILVGVLLSGATTAEEKRVPNGSFVLETAVLRYHLNYITKHMIGVSQKARGKGVCAETCRFFAAVPVKSFISADANRDSNMIDTLDGDRYPFIEAHITVPRNLPVETFWGQFEIKLAGKVKVYKKVAIHLVRNMGPRYSVTGTIPLRLSDFDIERPSLLFVEVEDSVPLEFEATWVRQAPEK